MPTKKGKMNVAKNGAKRENSVIIEIDKHLTPMSKPSYDAWNGEEDREEVHREAWSK
jgi:hypothetical protein